MVVKRPFELGQSRTSSREHFSYLAQADVIAANPDIATASVLSR